MTKKKTKPRITMDMRVAFHEAGHAVASYKLEYAGAIKRVTIIPDDKQGYLGCVSHYRAPKLDEDGFYSPVQYRKMHHMIMVFLAGPMAEHKLTGRWNYIGGRSDINKVTDFTFALCSSNRSMSQFYRWIKIETEDMVDANWDKISLLANALLEHKTIKGSEVQRIINPRLVELRDTFQDKVKTQIA